MQNRVVYGFVSCAATLFAQGILITALACTAGAQTSNPSRIAPPVNADSTAEDYAIGPGDILSITISDAPEWGGKFRVDGAGEVEIGGIPQPIKAEGKSPAQLSREMEHALVEAKQFRDPRVNVFVDEFHGRTVDVLGAVAKPASYPLLKRTNVLEAVSMAGGALPGAGGTVTVVRGPASAEATGTAVGSVQIVDMARVISGGDLSGNVQVRNGDVINVSTAQVVYVVGGVVRPGGFALSDPAAGMSAVKALAMAQGFRPAAAGSHAVIIRQSTSDTGRREEPVNLTQILSGKATDVVLAPDDILYIPDSTSKKALKTMGEVAMTMVNGIAIYGVGLRVAGQ